MSREKLQQRQDGRYKCKFGDKYFYGKTPTEANRKRRDYVREFDQGLNPDMSETPFLEYALGWRQAFRAECNTKMQRQYDNMIIYAALECKSKPVPWQLKIVPEI